MRRQDAGATLAEGTDMKTHRSARFARLAILSIALVSQTTWPRQASTAAADDGKPTDAKTAAEAKAPAEAKPLAARVQIRRTQYGVPHIQGETLEAAAFGFGYCQAEDHLINVMRGISANARHVVAVAGSGREQQAARSRFFQPAVSHSRPRGRQLSPARSRLSRNGARALRPG